MARVTPVEYAEKWARRTQAATPDYQKGIDRVTESPTEAAAQQVALYLQHVQEEAEKWQRRLRSVSLAEWKTAAKVKGGARISSGVQGAQGKMATAAAVLLPIVDRVSAEVRAMPKGSIEERIARSAAYQRAMHQAFNS